MDRTSAATHPVGFFNRPFGLPFGGHLRPRAAQPYGPIRFRRPRPYLPRRKSNTGAMECEKCGLVEKEPLKAKGLVGRLKCPGGISAEMRSVAVGWVSRLLAHTKINSSGALSYPAQSRARVARLFNAKRRRGCTTVGPPIFATADYLIKHRLRSAIGHTPIEIRFGVAEARTILPYCALA